MSGEGGYEVGDRVLVDSALAFGNVVEVTRYDQYRVRMPDGHELTRGKRELSGRPGDKRPAKDMRPVPTQLPARPDWMTEQVNESLRGENKSLNAIGGIPGNGHEYLRLRELSETADKQRDAIEAFNIFIKRWVHPEWWGHLMDDDENDAEFVRQAIAGAVEGESCPSSACTE